MDRFVNSGSHEDTDDVGYARRGRGGGRSQPQAASKQPDEKQQPAPGCRACSDFKAFVKAGGPGTKASFVFVQLFRIVLTLRQDWTNAVDNYKYSIYSSQILPVSFGVNHPIPFLEKMPFWALIWELLRELGVLPKGKRPVFHRLSAPRQMRQTITNIPCSVRTF